MHCLCAPSPFLLQLPSPRHSQAPGLGFYFRSLSQLPLLLPPIRSRNPPSHDQLDSELELDSESEEEEEDFDEFEIDDVAAEDYIIHEVEYVSEDEDDEEGEGERFGVDEADPAVQSEDEKLARVNKFIAEVWEFGAEMIDYQELAGIYDFPIDKFQRLAIQAFLRGSSVVVSAPTSSGKTLIAEASALATLARKRRLFYTTPLKALSNQKFRDFKKLYGDYNVGLLTGDSAVNKNAPILIMTTEILRNMLYQSVGMASSESRLFHVDVIVLDEVHYLSDISRGTVWEEIVIYCPKDVQLICLSATVANPDELAGWIGQIHGKTELVTSNKRPVPLTWHFSRKNGLLPLLDDKGKKVNKKLSLEFLKKENARKRNNRNNSDRRNNNNSSYISKQALVPQIQDTLNQLKEKDMLPAIWFIFSRKGCDAALQYLDHFTLLNECEASEVELEIRRFKSQYPDAVREGALKSLRRGITAHHAGCLPLWKSFIEELFQRGLIKVIFATETLAAGINMPARTAVIASLTKRIDSGRTMLSPNQLLQMAGRAGRRGIDKKGHVVLLQAHDVEPEECCDLLFKGVEPLVSQFKASYGMVLNLLAGSTLTNNLKDSEGRTLEEARKLIEQSFGNYVGSNVIVAAKEELERIKKDIEKLSSEITDEAMDRKCRDQLSAQDYSEISSLQEEIRKETKKKSELRKQMNVERIKAWKPLLEESENGNNLPFICLQYSDKDSILQVVPAVFLGKLEHFSSSTIINMVNSANSTGEENQNYYVALSSDNTWYVFTEKFIKMVYRTGLSALSPVEGSPLPRDTLKMLLSKEESRWENLSDSESGPLFCMEGSLDTWSWSLNVPVLSSLQEDDEVKNISEEYMEVLGLCKKQRRKVSKLKKAMKNTKGFEVFRTIVNGKKHIIEQIGRLNSRSKRLTRRIGQIEPTGWKEFLQISRVIQETRAMDINAQVIYPLGETAAGIRGENELWLAMVIRNKILLDLKPAQLAAVCGSIVSEGIKLRPWKTDSYVYESTSTVLDVIKRLEEQKDSLLQIQERNGVNIPCELDSQFSGMVEAWASGLTWREIMMDCAMDEGDLARLLRRTIDLLAQIPKLPDIDPTLQRNASLAWNIMDRAPISELLG